MSGAQSISLQRDAATEAGGYPPARTAARAPISKMIVIEFNELCPPLLDRFMAQGQLPNFKRFYDSAQIFVTEADVADPRYLEPWIQWYSLHTGLAYDQHHVYHLTDGPAAGHPDIWQVLNDAGRTTANCGSMNARGFDRPGGYFLPDPWCTTEPAAPAELADFHRIVSRQVQEYTNADALGLGDYARFLAFMIGHGLRPSTALAAARQVIRDRVFDRKEEWRRAVLLDKLQLDLFRHLHRRYRPDFSTFFCNSTAHYQHAYWRYMEPEPFAVKPSAEEAQRFDKAILYGYQQMDQLVGDFIALAGSDTTLVLATALSQQPFLKQQEHGGQHFYRPRKVEKLLADIGVAATQVLPVMTHQYIAHFPDTATRDAAMAAFGSWRYDGRPLFGFDESDGNSLYFGNAVGEQVPKDATVTIAGSNQGIPFYELFYQIQEVKSGRHHPDGVLWIRTGSHDVHPKKVSVLDVFPTVLDMYGVEIPQGMLDYRGRSLTPLMM